MPGEETGRTHGHVVCRKRLVEIRRERVTMAGATYQAEGTWVLQRASCAGAGAIWGVQIRGRGEAADASRHLTCHVPQLWSSPNQCRGDTDRSELGRTYSHLQYELLLCLWCGKWLGVWG